MAVAVSDGSLRGADFAVDHDASETTADDGWNVALELFQIGGNCWISAQASSICLAPSTAIRMSAACVSAKSQTWLISRGTPSVARKTASKAVSSNTSPRPSVAAAANWLRTYSRVSCRPNDCK